MASYLSSRGILGNRLEFASLTAFETRCLPLLASVQPSRVPSRFHTREASIACDILAFQDRCKASVELFLQMGVLKLVMLVKGKFLCF